MGEKIDRLKGGLSNINQRFWDGPRRSPFEIIFGLFLQVFKWIVFIGSFLILFLILTAFFNAYTTGEAQVLATRLEVAVTNSGFLQPAYLFVRDGLNLVKNPANIEKKTGWSTDVDKNKDNQDLGLKFVRKLTPLKQRYLPNEEIIATTAVEISSLKEASSVKFSCNVTKNLPIYKQVLVNPNEPVTVNKNERRRFEVNCRIPEGIELPSDKEVLENKIRLNADYDFSTKSYLDVYTMQKSYLDNLINKGINPFEKEINDRLDKNTGQVKPVTTYGPMEVILRLDYTQPLTEQGPFINDNSYSLGLKLEKTDFGWYGKLSKINNVNIYLPKNFEIIDDNFEEVFDFKEQGGFDGVSFRRYKLKQNKIDDINNQCNPQYGKFLSEDCDTLFEQGFIIAFTKFKVNNVESGLTKDFFGAEVDYDFQAQSLASVTIVKNFV